MITLLWEDEQGLDARRFGPHVLLVACVADDLSADRRRIDSRLRSLPKKGNGNVVRAIREDLPDLCKPGPVMAILDSDQIAGLLGEPMPAPICLVRASKATLAKFPGDYQLLLLERSVDTLVSSVCQLTSQQLVRNKATPDERDRILCKAAWNPSRRVRDDLRGLVPTFDRLVRRLAKVLNEGAP